MPMLAKPTAISMATGIISTAHGEVTRPMTSMTTMKPTAYRKPRKSAMKISPMATSMGPRDVWSIAW